jgi:hypothetical protein
MTPETQLGASHYLLTVLYDFYGHTLLDPHQESNGRGETKKRRHRLIHIVCHNRQVTRVQTNSDIKARIASREAELRQELGCGHNNKEKDWQLIHEFLGWGQTHDGHFVFLYYTGPDAADERACAMRRPEHWKLVSKEHLSLFHSRFTRNDIASQWSSLSSSDVVSTGDGRRNLGLDARYLAGKWLNAHREKHLQLLIESRPLFSSADKDYVQKLHRHQNNNNTDDADIITPQQPRAELVSDLIDEFNELTRKNGHTSLF